MRNELPIGVFDSGIGGLTVASAIADSLPNERILYFGDTARCPYGDRDPEEVIAFSFQVLDFLYKQGVKLFVVACNTATAVALPALERRYRVPVIGVIRPGSRAAVKASGRYRIGVIGTAVTIGTGAYEQAIKSLCQDAEVFSLACPRFVPLVESGRWSGSEVEAIVRDSLTPFQLTGIDTLILGCTHYPLLQDVIHQVMGSGVCLISSAQETALEVARILTATGSSADHAQPRPHRYFTSGDSDKMQAALRHWMPSRSGGAPSDVVSVHSFDSPPVLASSTRKV